MLAIARSGTHGSVPVIGPLSPAQLQDNLGALMVEFADEQIARRDAVRILKVATAARTPITRRSTS